MRDTTSPPIIAEMMPAMGGNPDATATPKHKGNAIRNTKKPADRSARQCRWNWLRSLLKEVSCDVEFFIVFSDFPANDVLDYLLLLK